MMKTTSVFLVLAVALIAVAFGQETKAPETIAGKLDLLLSRMEAIEKRLSRIEKVLGVSQEELSMTEEAAERAVPAYDRIISGPEIAVRPASVGGVVTLDGEPVECVVEIRRDGSGAVKRARTDENGRYHLSVASMVTGTHRVKIWRVEIEDNVKLGKQLPERYNARSDLNIDIKPGENVFNFDLTSELPAAKARY